MHNFELQIAVKLYRKESTLDSKISLRFDRMKVPSFLLLQHAKPVPFGHSSN